MVTTHNLGFPRIGASRELKRALEGYWSRALSRDDLLAQAQQLRIRHWRWQAGLDLVPTGDFSLYDHVLDMSDALGNLPTRVQDGDDRLGAYFRAARGRAGDEGQGACVHAAEMTKWFDTNYHYLVPEFSATTSFRADASRLRAHFLEAKEIGVSPKPVLVGPLTYLWLGKSKDGTERLSLLDSLVEQYRVLLEGLREVGATWVQIDEPLLVMDLTAEWRQAVSTAYERLQVPGIRLLLTTYFGGLGENLELVSALPVAGLHLDATVAPQEVGPLMERLRPDQVLSLGVVNGRNVWKADLKEMLDWLEPVHEQLGERLWLAPSCSLLHVPVDLALEAAGDPQILSWLAFARQKLEEVKVLARALSEGRAAVRLELENNALAQESRRRSKRTRDASVRAAASDISEEYKRRRSAHAARATIQSQALELPAFPTTTIGSFPQTADIRRARRRFRQGELSSSEYRTLMQREIQRAVKEQEALGLDVLVHGEPERNDMVEYFGEQLGGFFLTQCGWVQSYGSRCVKPPILFGDVTRREPMTLEWSAYAQSLTQRPMKGMLTGPVTILNWSFVRDDLPRRDVCFQLALAIRKEVLDLERGGISIIQIDEAALREGMPLRHAEREAYLEWAVDAFRIAAGGVSDKTQIHTHMCYSEFNDIMSAIARMDADVITIETSRSDMELLQVFKSFQYPNQIGPGVYDIHSPNTPQTSQIAELVRRAAQHIPKERLWVNPDCGLKTRRWEEVLPALQNMVSAARELRAELR